MAAPPIPPKGSSNSWIKDNRVGDHVKWRADNQNTFSTNGAQSTPPHICFDDKFSANHTHSTSQATSFAPPLPPRRYAEGMWELNQNQRYSSEISELSLIPPPPGTRSTFKTSHKSLDFCRNSNTKNTSNHLAAGVLFSTMNSTIPVRVSSSPQMMMPFNNTKPLTVGFSTDNFVNVHQKPHINNITRVAFSNNTYQATAVPYMPHGFDIQHSKSAPDLPNFKPNLLTESHRLSLPTSYNNNANAVRNLTVTNSFPTASGTNTNAGLENVLKFIKKKRDSNLIDLYCGEDAAQHAKYVSCKKSQFDDILKLFDPLSEITEETIITPPGENRDSDVSVLTNQNIDVQKETLIKEVYNNTSDSNTNDPINKEISPVKNADSKTEETIYATIKFSSQTSNDILKIAPCSLICSGEVRDFCHKLKKLRSEFSYDDYPTNDGLVISPTLDNFQEDALSIKLIITSNYSDRPVSFTCDVNTSIEHIISHTVCTVFDDTGSLSMDDFVLKVHGLSEYFSAHSTLADYEYVHQCHKFDKPVYLTLTDVKDLKRPLARTKVDDCNDIDFKLSDVTPSQKKETVTYEMLNILIETLDKEAGKIKSSAMKYEGSINLCPQGVVQAVKAICTLLLHVETTQITDAVSSLIHVCLLYGKSEDTDFNTLTELNELRNSSGYIKNEKIPLQNQLPLLELTLKHLQQAIHQLLIMYSKTFSVDFEMQCAKSSSPDKFVTDFLDTLLFQLCMVHRLPPNSSVLYECYNVQCEIYHGENLLASVSSRTVPITKSFFPRVLFEEWLQFETIFMCTLPREAVLRFTLWGISASQSDSKQADGTLLSKTVLGWCCLRLFTHEKELVQGSFLLGFWPPEIPLSSGPAFCNLDITCPLLQINFPEFGCAVIFPPVIDNKFASSQKRHFDNLEPNLQTTLMEIINRDALSPLKPEEKELLWEKRNYLYEIPHALPKVLLSAHGWDWACLSDIYSLLKGWLPLSPVDALRLLLPCFPDLEVRQTAIRWMKDIVSDELCDYLPQIIQVLRYETWEDSPVAWFLLERSLTSVRVAHYMYWLLKQNVADPVVGYRMQLMLNALLTIAGRAVRNRVETQEALLWELSNIAEKIKTAKESLRLSILFHDLEITHHNLVDSPTCLPLSPSVEVCGVDVKSCSYFTSNTLPLKLSFHSPEKEAKNNEAIYKVGDDLRQDMITLQMIRIMDKLWLKEGLDLKIVTFMCVATEYRKGMVELVPEAETLRKIQTELGLTGSFKDRPIAEWLQKYNTSELEYQQAVENFTLSCAGYCVATYILGICDRHNDNIMLKTSGHIFHIDFGKFLGDSQMFGSIKRDRTPFVLTSDMAYVINGGDKPTKRFQYFIDLCCQAFNIIRKHSGIFFNLFMLMVASGIQGMSPSAVSYIQNALLPGLSEAEATAQFTRMIQESLKSWFTQFNFFIHNLAQLRFTGDHNDGLLLSFIPKTFSKDSDGKILSTDVIGCQKMYDPEKYYIYVIKVERLNLPVPMNVLRTYREFIEFHQKLCMMFPLAKFHPLPGNPLMGRTNIREVADRRKSELRVFLKSLICMAEEIAHCNLVYTFFHPLLRDQEGMAEAKEAKAALVRSRRSSSVGQINGQVKLSIVYKNKSLFIMVMHAKNLSSPRGTAPDPYVKTYLLPDPNKVTKRKTKTASKNSHPTFMEMLVYEISLEDVCRRSLHVSVWDYDRVQENEFLGATLIPLVENNLSKERVQWYQLGNFNN